MRERRGEGGDGAAVGRGEEGRRRQREGLRGGEGGDGVAVGRGEVGGSEIAGRGRETRMIQIILFIGFEERRLCSDLNCCFSMAC